MSLVKIRSLVLVTVSSFVAVFILMGLMQIPPVLALEQTGTDPARQVLPAQPPPPNDDDLSFIAFFTDELTIEITDLGGNVVGEGVHGGKARCNRTNCSQKTDLEISLYFTTTTFQLDYKFTTRQAIDPVERRVVIAGTGTRTSESQTENFSFTATLQDNTDGTIGVRYKASRPDASFIIPAAPGRMVFR